MYGEGDHFPIPERNGGKEIVPCCMSCHDMKDRFLPEDWPIEWVSKFFQDFKKFNLKPKILFAKVGEMVFFKMGYKETRVHEKCFCCGALLIQNQKPETVPCCEACHALKDSIQPDEWPTEWVNEVITDFPEFSRETRIYWAKILSAYSDLIEDHKKARRTEYLF
jgi:hypothetical protein